MLPSLLFLRVSHHRHHHHYELHSHPELHDPGQGRPGEEGDASFMQARPLGVRQTAAISWYPVLHKTFAADVACLCFSPFSSSSALTDKGRRAQAVFAELSFPRIAPRGVAGSTSRSILGLELS
jgi:hypothetical protein